MVEGQVETEVATANAAAVDVEFAVEVEVVVEVARRSWKDLNDCSHHRIVGPA